MLLRAFGACALRYHFQMFDKMAVKCPLQLCSTCQSEATAASEFFKSASIRSTAIRHSLQPRADRYLRKARLFRTVHRIRAVEMLATRHNIYRVVFVGKIWRTHVYEHHGEAQRAVALGYRELRRVSGTIPKPKRVYAAFALSPSRRETR